MQATLGAKKTPSESLAAQLFEVARLRAESAGRHIGRGAHDDLRTMTRKGALALLKIKDETERTARIQEAERSIERLIDFALENAITISNYPADLLGEESYFPARLRFCPCRPFC